MPSNSHSARPQRRQVALCALLLALLSVLRGPGARAQEAPATVPGPGVTIFLVRHAEKSTQDARDPELTAQGVKRSQALARLLGKAGLTHLFATDYKRTRATLAPLVEASGLEVLIYDPRRPAEVLARLRSLPAGSVALVAGHSNTTPALFEALAGREGGELEDSPQGALIPEGDYDRLYCLTLVREAEGRARCAASFELRYGE
jgi:broad specificity phosphatase PhoE